MVFDQFLYHCLYNETYNPPVAAPAPVTPSVQKAPAGWENTMAVVVVAPVAAAALPPEAENAPSRTGKHSGPEGRNSAKIEPKNSLTSLLKP